MQHWGIHAVLCVIVYAAVFIYVFVYIFLPFMYNKCIQNKRTKMRRDKVKKYKTYIKPYYQLSASFICFSAIYDISVLDLSTYKDNK